MITTLLLKRDKRKYIKGLPLFYLTAVYVFVFNLKFLIQKQKKRKGKPAGFDIIHFTNLLYNKLS